jgi:hypothetical protein
MMLLDSGAGGAERTGGGGFDGFAGMTFRPAMVSQDEGIVARFVATLRLGSW